MKKTALLTFLILLFVFQKTNAQVLRDVGLKSGISISKQTWIYGNGGMTFDKDYRTGMDFALNLEWFNHDYITLITDVGYIQKGFKEEIMMTTPDNPESGPLKTIKTRFEYLYLVHNLKSEKNSTD